jgi:tripartite-type tricarboxylate transporter receptor subunit TctC
MKQNRFHKVKSFICGLFISTMSLTTSFAAYAQNAVDDYPTKPIKIVAPVAAGGGLDNLARKVGERLSRALGQPIIVENMGGNGGVIASQAVSRAAPDGYTLMISYVATHGTNPAVRKLPYDAIKDFSLIGMIGATPNVLIINKDLPVKNLKEFVEYSKKNPGKLSYGSAGMGSLTHLGLEQFKMAGDFYMVHIPYRGISPAFTDLIGGQTQAAFPTIFAALPLLKADRVRALAVTGLERSSAAPNIPTFEELGYKGFDGEQWYGIAGPANIPEPIVKKLNTELNKVLKNPEFAALMKSEAMNLMPMSPEQYKNYIKQDIARWTKVAKNRQITID